MTTVGAIYDAINRLAPFSTAMEWDNVGLLIGGRDLPISQALLALDLTPAVLEEAVQLGVELVVTHHPVIFGGLKRLEADSVPFRAVQAGISVISAHTNLDLAEGGVNDALAQRLGLEGIRPFVPEKKEPYRKVAVFVPAAHAEAVYSAMAQAGAGQAGNYSHCGFLARGEGRFLPLEGATPSVGSVGALERVEEVRLEMLCRPDLLGAVVKAMQAAHPYEQPAFDVVENHALTHQLSLGRVGGLARSMSPAELAAHAKACLGAAGVRYVDGGKPVEKVAVVGGSGADCLTAAKGAGVQALITGEAKHNQLLEAAELGITFIDAGHFATENVVMEPLCSALEQGVSGCGFRLSRRCTDGVQYLA